MDNGLENQQRRKNPDSFKFTYYGRYFGTKSKIEKIYADIKIVANTKINHIMISFTDHYNTISIDIN